MRERRLILLTEAARRLGISNTTMRRLVREGRVQVHENPLDKRQKLVDPVEIERLRPPLELPEGQENVPAGTPPAGNGRRPEAIVGQGNTKDGQR